MKAKPCVKFTKEREIAFYGNVSTVCSMYVNNGLFCLYKRWITELVVDRKLILSSDRILHVRPHRAASFDPAVATNVSKAACFIRKKS